eukprot:g701.t1
MSDMPCEDATPCPTGSVCLRATTGDADTFCKACGVGKYNELEGMAAETDSCKKCPEGKYSDILPLLTDPVLEDECKKCPGGYFLDSKGHDDISDCIACAAGKYSDDGEGQVSSSVCTSCIGGKYSVAGEAQIIVSVCEACEGGRYSDDGEGQTNSSVCKACTGGRYSDEGAGKTEFGVCKACIIGKYSDAGTAQTSEAVCKPCGAGKYSGTGASGETAESHCVKCGKGKYSGELGARQEDTCKECGKGKYLDELGKTSESSCKVCSVGRKGELEGLKAAYDDSNNAVGCVNCSTGKHQDITGSSACKDVGEGEYSDEEGLRLPKQCPKGEHGRGIDDEEGTEPHERGGTGLLIGRTGCNLCPMGFVNADLGSYTCTTPALGMYADEYGLIEAYGCPTGYFSTNLRVSCQACPAGKFNDAERKSSEKIIAMTAHLVGMGQLLDNQICPDGWKTSLKGKSFCDECATGKKEVTNTRFECIDCLKGFFQPEKAKNECPSCFVGQFTIDPGQYTDDGALASEMISCKECDAGKRENNRIECIACSKGFFQPSKGNDTCPSCPVGQFTADPSQTTCIECDAGKRENNRIECVVCPKGFFQDQKARDFCPACEAGQYTDDGTLASEMTSCKECDAGKRENNRIECIACSKGFFQPSKGNDTCPSCPVGQFTADPSQTTCIECDAGKRENNRIECVVCPKGFFQDQKARDFCPACEAGQYTDDGTLASEMTSCKECDAGKRENNRIEYNLH